jgi:hypothetical protein
MISESEEVDAKGKSDRILYLDKLLQLVLGFKGKEILAELSLHNTETVHVA